MEIIRYVEYRRGIWTGMGTDKSCGVCKGNRFHNAPSESPLSCPASDYQSPPMSPSDMIEDQLVQMDRVRAIEATMDEMKSQHEATHQLLQDILTRLGPTQAQNVQDPLPTCLACRSPTPSIPADVPTVLLDGKNTQSDRREVNRTVLSG